MLSIRGEGETAEYHSVGQTYFLPLLFPLATKHCHVVKRQPLRSQGVWGDMSMPECTYMHINVIIITDLPLSQLISE